MLKLKLNADPSKAAQQMTEQAASAQSVAYPAPGIEGSLAVMGYEAWVTTTETYLRNYFLDPDIWLQLRGVAYWFIVTPGNADMGIKLHIQRELAIQANRLERLAQRLVLLNERLRAAPGSVTVVDTNVLLHYERPDQVDWLEVCDRAAVRLVLPLRVVEELDQKKYTARTDIADRARRLISDLWSRLAPTKGGPVTIRPGVTIEVPIDDEPRVRTFDADQEVLDLAEQLKNAEATDVTLLTGDGGLGLRGVVKDLRILEMPQKYLRRKDLNSD
jgi:hypothetical protein